MDAIYSKKLQIFNWNITVNCYISYWLSQGIGGDSENIC